MSWEALQHLTGFLFGVHWHHFRALPTQRGSVHCFQMREFKKQNTYFTAAKTIKSIKQLVY